MAAQFHNVDFASSVDHETFLGLRRISGTKIVAQSPPGCIVPEGAGPQRKPCLFDFDVMQEYIIPRKAFFNRFVAVNEPEGKYTVLGLPVAIAHPKYQRNEFIFNFGLVVVRLPAHSAAPHPVLSCPVDHNKLLSEGEDKYTAPGARLWMFLTQDEHAIGERCRPDPLREGCAAACSHVRRDGEAERVSKP